MVRNLDPPETWNLMGEDASRATKFYHRILPFTRLETHTFVLPVGEVTVTLEDVAHIYGLLIDGEIVSGWTDSSQEFLHSQNIVIFGCEPTVRSSSKSYIKLAWVYCIRDAKTLDTLDSIQRYVKCQIFYLLDLTLFADKSTAYAHAKALCRASHYDTKEMDDLLNFLFVWAWERVPCTAPVLRQYLPAADVTVARRWSHFA
ncbi:hypothetical protein AHAS_Ahas02G0100000 [Arachis hypogaea]